jgi:hypothetical protein
MILKNNLKAASQINRQYDSQFAVAGAKIGSSLAIRVPWRPSVQPGPSITPQDFVETTATLTINQQPVVPVQFTSAERSLSLDDYSQRVLEPAMATLANDVDRHVLALYSGVWNSVEVPQATDNYFLPYLQAGAQLDDNCAPRDRNRAVVIGPWQQVDVVDNLKGLFQASDRIADQYEQGTMGLAGGWRWSMDQNVYAHTVGPLGGVPVVAGGSQTGTSLNTDAWTAAVGLRVRAGDVFTIEGVYGVNPQTRQSTGKLQQFVATANASSDIGGLATLQIQPAITTSGAYQTVTASPQDGAALTFLGTANGVYTQGLAFHRDAFTLATVDLDLPTQSAEASRASDDQLGVSLRMTRQWEVLSDQWITRAEILYGVAAIRPEWACRLWQAQA